MNEVAVHPKLEDFEDFFENSLCGYLILDPNGYIIRGNNRFSKWLGISPDGLKGTRFSDYLPIGAKIYYETHLAPLLRMQGCFDEIAMNLLTPSGEPFSILANAFEHKNKEGKADFIRLTAFKATDRRSYETNLLNARKLVEENLLTERDNAQLREQFIAALGHDLRNPLGAITSGIQILKLSGLEESYFPIIETMDKSAERIRSLIEDLMDFARGRLGGGMSINVAPVFLVPTFVHVVEELRAIWPERLIETKLDISEPVECDSSRLAQLLSNLLSNAITHGSPNGPVTVNASIQNNFLKLSVSNSGSPIPAATLEHIFQPFKHADAQLGQKGLGLGLYIASEIARAHKGTLTATSDDIETCFILEMPLRQSS